MTNSRTINMADLRRWSPVVLGCLVLTLAAWLVAEVCAAQFLRPLREHVSDFEEISGVSLKELPSGHRDALLVWWEEYRLPAKIFEVMVSLEALNARSGKLSETKREDLDQLNLDIDWICTKLHEQGHLITKEDIAAARWLFKVPVPAEEFAADEEMVALVGWIPESLRRQVPALGKLEHPFATAELREFTDWTGQPVSLEVIRQGLSIRKFSVAFQNAINEAATLEDIYQAFFNDSVALRAIKRGRPDENIFLTDIYLSLVEQQVIPRPRMLSAQLHAQLRKNVVPGEQEFLQQNQVAYPARYEAVSAYAQAKDITDAQAASLVSIGALAMHGGPLAATTLAWRLGGGGIWGVLTTIFSIVTGIGLIALIVLVGCFFLRFIPAKEIREMVNQYRTGAPQQEAEPAKIQAVVASPARHPAQPPLAGMQTDPNMILQEMNSRGPFGRIFRRINLKHMLREATQLLRAGKEHVEAEADLALSILRGQQKLNDVQDQEVLRPMKVERDKSQMEAEIAKSKRDKAQWEQEAENLRNPRLSPQQPRKPTYAEKEDKLYAWRQDQLQALRQRHVNGQLEDEALQREEMRVQEEFEMQMNVLREKSVPDI